jgi:hypothetical protein
MDRLAYSALDYGEEEIPMSQILELPDSVYNALVEAAKAAGETPAHWIAAHLPPAAAANGEPAPTEEEIAAADARLEACIISLGRSTGSDNESIDADLAREYGDDHADLYRPGRGS